MRFLKTLTFLILAMGLLFALSAWAQQKPFTQEQVSNMVRDGLGDDMGAKAIERRRIDFAPVEDSLQSLKGKWCQEPFLAPFLLYPHPIALSAITKWFLTPFPPHFPQSSAPSSVTAAAIPEDKARLIRGQATGINVQVLLEVASMLRRESE